jgi:4-amino-4-deoxy-L-arabinose transferase-like glycosyltransferase
VNEAPSAVDRPPEPQEYARAKWIVALAYLALQVAGACVPPLQEPDEARCASISWEMLQSGDWLTPHLNSIKYYEKPPLFFWLETMGLGLVGPSNLAFRLPSILASFLTVMLVYHWGLRMRGSRAGLLAAAIQASMLLFSMMARAALVDPLLTFCTTFSLYCAFRFLETPEWRSRWSYAFWAALAAAALVKGPVGIVLPAAALAAFLLWNRDSRGWRILFHPGGILLFGILATPWYAVMTLRNPGYLTEFLLSQNLDRLVEGSRFNRNKPLWFYLPVLLTGLIPWTMFIPGLVPQAARAFKDRTLPEGRPTVFLVLAVLVPLAILSVAHSKLPHYLLPLTPPFSLLLADVLCQEWARVPLSANQARCGTYQFSILGVFLILFALMALVLSGMDAESICRQMGFDSQGLGHETDLIRIRTYQSPLPGAAAIAGITGILSLGAGWTVKRGRPWTATMGLSAALLLGAFSAQFLIASMGPSITSQVLATKVARHVTGDTPVLLYRRYLRGLTFYLRRPVIQWEALYNEFGHEISEADASRASLGGKTEVLNSFLDRHPDSIVVVDSPMRLEELKAVTCRRFDELEREGEFFLVRIHPDH